MVVEVTEETFEAVVLNAPGPVLVDFYHDGCGPCRRMAPVVAGVAAALAGEAVVAKVNVLDHPGLAQDYDVVTVPTFLVFRQGEPAGRLFGMQTADRLVAAVRG